jgi:hypothetical protein
MALVECPDCGRKVSDQATACPACAHPVAGRTQVAEAIAVGGGAPASRGRDNRPPGRLVVLETPARSAGAASASASASEPRQAATTYRFVCHLCGEDEVLLYRPRPAEQHVCGTCEEAELVSGVERRRLFHWWPLVLLVVLFVGGGLVLYSLAR